MSKCCESKVRYTGLNFHGLLFLLLLGLKLTGHIDWPWWWVTAPLWGPLAVLLALFVAALLAVGVWAVVVWIVGAIQKRMG